MAHPTDMDGKPYAVGQTVLVAGRIEGQVGRINRRVVAGFTPSGLPRVTTRLSASAILHRPDRHYIEKEPSA